MSNHAPERRRLRFTLRTLFVVVSVLCVSLVWMVWQFEGVREREKLLKGHVGWDVSHSHPARLPFLWSLLGASPVNSINLPEDEFSDDDLRKYRAAFPEADVTLEKHPRDPVTYIRKRSAHRKSQSGRWSEVWSMARPFLGTLVVVAVVAFAFELIWPRVTRRPPPYC